MNVNFFKKKFYGCSNSALLPKSEMSFEDYIKATYKSEVVKTGHDFVEDDYVRENIRMVVEWLSGIYASCIMTGGVGIGKTILMKSLMHFFDSIREPITMPPLRCRQIAYYDASEMCIKYVSSEEVRYEVANCKILFVDDLGCEASEYRFYGNVAKPVQEILMYRYSYRLPTIIATNLSLEEFAERYGDRVADRVNELYATLEFPAHESYRCLPLVDQSSEMV